MVIHKTFTPIVMKNVLHNYLLVHVYIALFISWHLIGNLNHFKTCNILLTGCMIHLNTMCMQGEYMYIVLYKIFTELETACALKTRQYQYGEDRPPIYCSLFLPQKPIILIRLNQTITVSNWILVWLGFALYKSAAEPIQAHPYRDWK